MTKQKELDSRLRGNDKGMKNPAPAPILVVDDRPENIVLVEETLRDMNLDIVTATSGRAALKAVLERDFALILLDVVMPGMDGFETAALIRCRERSCGTPIIFLTAVSTADEHIRRGYALGAVDYIIKPFAADELQWKVQAYAEIYRARTALQTEILRSVSGAGEATILIVDDSEANCQSMAEVLKPLGERIITAASGRETISVLLKEEVAVLILDVHMPGMDGFETAALIRENERFRSLNIIFITAINRALQDIKRGYELGAIDYIFTPYQPDILQAKIRILISLYKSRRTLESQLREIRRLNAALSAKSEELQDLNKSLEEQVQQRTEDLMASEERYRIAVEGGNDGLVMLRGEEIIFVNQRLVEMLGYDGPEELAGKPFAILIHPDEREAAIERRHRRLRGDAAPTHLEVMYVTRQGMPFPVEVSVSEVFYHGGKATLSFIRDISERKAAEAARQEYYQRQRQSLQGLIRVVAATVEIRDPYTAGHQSRVARLVRHIAQELGYDQERAEGVRLAGTIHDLGKIGIPAEILSKPGKISAIELSLIKAHPQKGYDILKDIEFPWPIAKMVHQHHERLDGSGYPQGLRGKEIMLEARLIAVADVVEAMASHRPYRPALGIGPALKEIEAGSGRCYDPQVTDACLRLFREKGYKLE